MSEGAYHSEANGGQVVRRVERDARGRLVVYLHGRDEPVRDAEVKRCFPWSVPERYLSIRDAEGREVALLEDIDDLDDASREVVAAELREKVFNPKVQRITHHRDEFGVTSLTAETDRGEVTFQVRSRDDVRVLSPTRALFRDADGNTFEVADVSALDRYSQKALSKYF